MEPQARYNMLIRDPEKFREVMRSRVQQQMSVYLHHKQVSDGEIMSDSRRRRRAKRESRLSR